MPRPSHLVQRRAGFSFRITVPVDLRPAVGLREVVRSLHAPTRRGALSICRRAGQRGVMAFAMLRRMTNAMTLDLRDYRAWLLEQIEQELTAFDRRTSTMTARERDDFDTFTDIALEEVERALEPPQRPHPAGDALARTVLERQHLSLDALDDQERHSDKGGKNYPRSSNFAATFSHIIGLTPSDGATAGAMDVTMEWTKNRNGPGFAQAPMRVRLLSGDGEPSWEVGESESFQAARLARAIRSRQFENLIDAGKSIGLQKSRAYLVKDTMLATDLMTEQDLRACFRHAKDNQADVEAVRDF